MTGYDTGDLRRFFAKGFRSMRFDPRQVERFNVFVTAAPQRSRGCAEMKGKYRTMVISLAAPWRASLRRLARLFEHEATHLEGYDHDEMPKRVLYSLGGVPRWAEGTVLRYHGRAPRQMGALGTRIDVSDRS